MIANNIAVRFLRCLGFALLSLVTACAFVEGNEPLAQIKDEIPEKFGVLVMAHGGTDDWNSGVEDSLEHLRSLYPVEIAFGMADAGSIERGVRKLEVQGVEHVGVVRLFISGESWLQRTAQILGIESGAPMKPTEHSAMDHSSMPMGFWKIDSEIQFHLSREGLSEAEEMDEVLLTRVRGLSSTPASEVVVIIAHGPADDSQASRDRRSCGRRARRAVGSQGARWHGAHAAGDAGPQRRRVGRGCVRGRLRRVGCPLPAALAL